MSLEFMRLQEQRIIATFGTLDINIDDVAIGGDRAAKTAAEPSKKKAVTGSVERVDHGEIVTKLNGLLNEDAKSGE